MPQVVLEQGTSAQELVVAKGRLPGPQIEDVLEDCRHYNVVLDLRYSDLGHEVACSQGLHIADGRERMQVIQDWREPLLAPQKRIREI